MRYYADLHIHSKYSRACSRDCDLEHLSWWARRKGITLLGTGDFTHPAWAEELRTKLVPAEPGLFKLREDLDREVLRTLPPSCHTPVRFLLEVEISTIYKRGDRTRKVHHLCYAPGLDAAAEFTRRLEKIGNLHSDGRPILGLDSRDLLEITLSAGEGAYLIPAHVWTPWFAVLGSKSGFDAVEDCYADLADHIFAVETGLSSDPAMNWRVSKLDKFHLVSNSDAHSPPMLGRNATVLDTDLDYFAVRDALATGTGYVGTVDMFPEEGKYHHDGHRKCGVRLTPDETRKLQGRCPECGKPLTVGVLYRVEELADRDVAAVAGPAASQRPASAGEFLSIVPLPEIMGEILRVGPKSKAVRQAVDEVVNAVGPEMAVLLEKPLDEIERAGSPLLVEAISRLRQGKVRREAGYDGEYGVISLFEPGEIGAPNEQAPGLFDMPAEVPAPRPARDAARNSASDPAKPARRRAAAEPAGRSSVDVSGDAVAANTGLALAAPRSTGSLLDGLDPDQRAAAELTAGQVLIVAGPGTGKTRTLTHRLAHLVLERDVPAEHCLAITFTRRACAELRERLAALAGEHAPRITVATFHALGVTILREQHERVGRSARFGVADDAQRLAVLRELAGEGTDRQARRLLAEVSLAKRTLAARTASSAATPSPVAADLADLVARYDRALSEQDLVDFDDLIALPVTLLAADPDLVAGYRDRFRWICVDEYQDVDELQYLLLRLLTPVDGNLCAIGDPDQAIYSFRGADVGFFLRFQQDYPSARLVQLTRNYRSSKVIVAGALAAIAPSSLVPGRELHAMRALPAADHIHVRSCLDEEAEAQFVVREIDTLLGGSSFHSRDSGRVDSDGFAHGVSFSDIAVLYRTDAQARPIAAALAREGLPFQKRSHDRLAEHPGVREVLRHLPAPTAPEVEHTPLRVLVNQAAQRATEAVARRNGLVAVDDVPDETNRDLVAAVREAVDLLAQLADAHSTTRDHQQLQAFLGFLSELRLGAEVDTWDPRADRISLLTLHAAKGLEFPVVFLVGCADGTLPLRWPGESEEDGAAAEAEERRLFFVGVSRAQTHLYLSHPNRRSRNGQRQDVRPSPFLAALGADLVERGGDAARARNSGRSHQLRLL